MLLDAHSHIYETSDKSVRDAILTKCSQPGVGRLFINSIRPTDWGGIASLAHTYHSVLPFYGIHPWHVDSARGDWVKELVRHLEKSGACVGEIGLDKKRKGADFELQRRVFVEQLDIAVRMKRPFNIHCVDAWGTIIEELAKKKIETPFIVHFFCGSKATLEELLRLGAYISYSGRSLEGAFKRPKEALKETPVDRILLETDFPYIGIDNPSSDDYFSYLEKTYALASEIRGINRNLLENAVWENGSVFTD